MTNHGFKFLQTKLQFVNECVKLDNEEKNVFNELLVCFHNTRTLSQLSTEHTDITSTTKTGIIKPKTSINKCHCTLSLPYNVAEYNITLLLHSKQQKTTANNMTMCIACSTAYAC